LNIEKTPKFRQPEIVIHKPNDDEEKPVKLLGFVRSKTSKYQNTIIEEISDSESEEKESTPTNKEEQK